MHEEMLPPGVREAADELARRAGFSDLASRARLLPIAGGGSNRSFVRLVGDARTAVLLFQPGGGWELESYVDVARFLARCGVGAPEIYAEDRERGAALIEDLGDLHLEDALRTASPAEEIASYRLALDMLVELETSVTDAMKRERFLLERRFDLPVLLGETEYFRREFIESFCPVPIPPSWEAERRFIAESLAHEEPVFMHRDLQSRNIMVKNGRLRIIDFQTAHRGPGLYDAAALLKDPYHPVPASSRRRLLEELHGKLAERGARGGERFGDFYTKFTLAGIQRNLQALAAYAKLGARMGKTRFLESIPNGLDLLEEGVRESGRFPGLVAIVAAARDRLRDRGDLIGG